MTVVKLAYECFADGDVVALLQGTCGLPLEGRHARSQGNVVNLLRDGHVRIGLVDEDPQGPHHRFRDVMPVVTSTSDVEWRRLADRHLLIVKPELEPCLLRSFQRLQFRSSLPKTPRELHGLLNVPNPRQHAVLRRELAVAHAQARDGGVTSLTIELERIVREILAA